MAIWSKFCTENDFVAQTNFLAEKPPKSEQYCSAMRATIFHADYRIWKRIALCNKTVWGLPIVGGIVWGLTNRDKTPNTGAPGSWHINPGDGKPGNGQERLYGPNGQPEVDIDWHPDHGAGKPHGHNWENGKRGPPVPLSPWPPGRLINGCIAQ